jgi:hypothetical protein
LVAGSAVRVTVVAAANVALQLLLHESADGDEVTLPPPLTVIDSDASVLAGAVVAAPTALPPPPHPDMVSMHAISTRLADSVISRAILRTGGQCTHAEFRRAMPAALGAMVPIDAGHLRPPIHGGRHTAVVIGG